MIEDEQLMPGIEPEDDGFDVDMEVDPGEDPRTRYETMRTEHLWCAKPADEFAAAAEERFDSHVKRYDRSGVGEAVYRSYRMFHGQDPEGFGGLTTRPVMMGEQGEFVFTQVNHYRNNILHQKALVSSERPAFAVHVSTNSVQAMEQVSIADSILQYALDNRGIGSRMDQGVERALVESIAWIALDWDASHGETGDVTAATLGVFDVAYQHSEAMEDMEWAVARRLAPKWKLAAEAARSGDFELAVEIAESSSDKDDAGTVDADPVHETLDGSDSEEEMVYVFHVYYKPCPQIPEGRYARFLRGGVILEDGPFPFREIPLYPICPSTFLGTQIPYSTSWDLMALQTLENAAISALYSRVDAFGLPNIAVGQATEIGLNDNGLSIWRVGPGESAPAQIDMLNDNPMVTKAIEMAEQLQNKISGINTVNRGQPSPDVTSGSQAALYEAQSVKFHSALERAFMYAMERVGTGIIKLYQAFADVPMLISISGAESGEMIVKEFTGSSLDSINNVSVKRTNPITRTQGFKVDTANALLVNGHINKREYMTVAKTGNLDILMDPDVTYTAQLKEENDKMLRGEPVKAAQLENPLAHMTYHLQAFNSRTREASPEAAKVIHEHIMQHMDVWMKASAEAPVLLALWGIPPAPSAAPGMGAPPPEDGKGPGRPPGPEPMPPSGTKNTTNAAVSMPSMPSPAKPKE